MQIHEAFPEEFFIKRPEPGIHEEDGSIFEKVRHSAVLVLICMREEQFFEGIGNGEQNRFGFFVKKLRAKIKDVAQTFAVQPLLPVVIQIFSSFHPIAFLSRKVKFYVKKTQTAFCST
jgi:hypothetical protein